MKPLLVHSLHGVDLEDYGRLVRRKIDRSSDPEGFEGFSDPFLARHFAREKQKNERKLERLEKVIRTGIPSVQEMQRVWLSVAGASVLVGLLPFVLPTPILPGKRFAFHVILGLVIVALSAFTRYRTNSPLAAVLVGAALWCFPVLLSFSESTTKGLLTLGFALGVTGKLAVLMDVFDRSRPLSKADHELLRTVEAENRPFDDELARINRLPEEERAGPLLALWASIDEESQGRLRQNQASLGRVAKTLWNENFRWSLILIFMGVTLMFASEKMSGKV